jgi:hypothetical protein
VHGKQAKTEQVAQRAAALLEEHFATLATVERNKARQELHQLATAVSRLARARAKTA